MFMMKHIKKSFLHQMSSEVFDVSIESKPEWESVSIFDNETLKKNRGKIIYCQTEKKITYAGFVQKIGNDFCVFPVPDPTLVHFHSAQMNLIHAKEFKTKLIKGLKFEEIKKDTPIHDLYNYYGHSTSVIINLFTSLEAFLNQQIPSDYIFKRKTGKCTEVFNYEQIFEYIDFKTKLTIIIPEITKKNFMGNSTPINNHIYNLKQFRDSVIHTKPKSESPLYQDLMKKSLEFDYDKAIEAVAKLMNFYQPGYIVECDCGNDY
jgi:hypothetical protein